MSAATATVVASEPQIVTPFEAEGSLTWIFDDWERVKATWAAHIILKQHPLPMGGLNHLSRDYTHHVGIIHLGYTGRRPIICVSWACDDESEPRVRRKPGDPGLWSLTSLRSMQI